MLVFAVPAWQAKGRHGVEWRFRDWTMLRTRPALLALVLASCSELGEWQGTGGRGHQQRPWVPAGELGAMGSVFSSGQESCPLVGAAVQGQVWGRSQEVPWADQGSAGGWSGSGCTRGKQTKTYGVGQGSEKTGGDTPAPPVTLSPWNLGLQDRGFGSGRAGLAHPLSLFSPSGGPAMLHLSRAQQTV